MNKPMKKLVEFCKSHRHIFCYGIGYYGKALRAFLYEHEIKIDGYLTTQKSTNEKWDEIPIYDPRFLSNMPENSGVIIGVSGRARDEIGGMLKKRGCEDIFSLSDEDLSCVEDQTNYFIEEIKYPAICVLYYHRICNLSLDTWRLAVSPNVFEEHIKWLKKKFQILSIEDDWAQVKRPSIVITFDDGYADIFYEALPILEKYSVPATIFVSTGNIDQKMEFWWDMLEQIFFCNRNLPDIFSYGGNLFSLRTNNERKATCYALHSCLKAMTSEERESTLREMASLLQSQISFRDTHRVLTKNELRKIDESPFVTIGGHTVSHPVLAVESILKQREEIEKSTEYLTRTLEHVIDVFSYPFGGVTDYTEETRKIACECGYQKIVTTKFGLVKHDTNLMEIPRNWVPNDCSVKRLERIIRKAWYYGRD